MCAGVDGCTLGERRRRRNTTRPAECFLGAKHHLAMPGQDGVLQRHLGQFGPEQQRGDPTVASLAWREQGMFEVLDEGATGRGQRLIGGLEIVANAGTNFTAVLNPPGQIDHLTGPIDHLGRGVTHTT